MASAAVASVPGKLILMGEHAAVYGRPALVAAIGLEAVVRAERAAAAGVEIRLPDVDYHATAGWPELIDHAARARREWEEYVAAPGPERFAALTGREAGHLAKIALGEAAREAAAAELPGLVLEVRSELPVGSGFGSSAAIAVGVLAATLTVLDGPTDLDTLERLALEVERRQHGTPSGVDHNTVLRGGVLEVTRAGEALAFRSLEVASDTLERFGVLHTGAPDASTGEVVAAVRAVRDRDRQAFERLLDRMAGNVVSFARRLSEESPDWERMADLIVDYQECLEAIGVVPPGVRAAVRAARQAGVAAKISGAGGLSDPGAGSLLVLDPGAGEELPSELRGFTHYPVRLGVPGLSIEVEA